MKIKLLMTILSVSLLLFSGSTVFAGTQTLAAPSATIGTTAAVSASVPMSKNVNGRYTGSASGVNYEAGVYHTGGTREFGTGGSYTSVYRKQCAANPCATITTTAGGSVAIDFSTAATWTAQ